MCHITFATFTKYRAPPTFTKYSPKLGFGRWTRAARRMGAVDKGVDMDSVTDRKGKLDTKVADDLLMDASVLQLMENPKVAGAIARLKEEPGCFAQMCADDPELGALPMSKPRPMWPD